ncbi:molybdenum cofactor guanylyltransferase [bacterium]|nr:molybdenum cofactor guanylyltransferase [bacterium]
MIDEAFVLAGGKSRRMGRPKALLELDGVGFLERVLTTLGQRIPRVFIVGAPPEPQRFTAWETVPDLLPGHGVLSGLHAGLLACRGEWAFCGCCDMPGLDARVPDILWEEADGRHDAVLPHAQKFPQPTLALYRASVAPRIPKFLERTTAKGEGRRLHTFLDTLRIQWVEERRFTMRGVPRTSFLNINDEEDLRELHTLWERQKRHADTSD